MMDVYTMKCTQECCANWGGEAVRTGDREETSPKASRVLGVSSPITDRGTEAGRWPTVCTVLGTLPGAFAEQGYVMWSCLFTRCTPPGEAISICST